MFSGNILIITIIAIGGCYLFAEALKSFFEVVAKFMAIAAICVLGFFFLKNGSINFLKEKPLDSINDLEILNGLLKASLLLLTLI